MENTEIDWETGNISKGGLPDGTRKYITEKYGIDNATIDAVIRGQIANTMVERDSLFKLAGGADKYAAAIEWATAGGGYTQAQKDAFNAALDKGGQARADAVEALMARAAKANPSGFPQARKGVSPQRTTSSAGSPGTAGDTSGLKPFESKAEWSAAYRKAKADGDQQAFDEVRKRYEISKRKRVPGFT
jgi:hypothetical protein